jgi:hypothetical protein
MISHKEQKGHESLNLISTLDSLRPLWPFCERND